jgi:hypothetical protein
MNETQIPDAELGYIASFCILGPTKKLKHMLDSEKNLDTVHVLASVAQ